MKFSSFKYLFKQGVRNFLNNKIMSVASVGVVASCLLLVGICASIAMNVNSFIKYLGEQNEIVIYLKDEITDGERESMKARLDSDEDVLKYTYVSKEEALEEQMSYLGSYANLLTGYQGENNPLPASFRVHITDLTRLNQVSLRFSAMDGIDYVSTSTELANVLIALKNTTYYAGLFILAILFMVSMVVISNTIRLTVYARRREIGIMKFVGATNGFIQLPFVVEGFLIGTVSAVITFILISAGYIYLYKYITTQATGFIGMISLSMIPYMSLLPYLIIGFLAFGWIIGCLGSAISMRRYLKV